MIILPNKPTKSMVEAGKKVDAEQIFMNVEYIYEAMAAAAPCPWIKIEGDYPESLINIPVYVSFDLDVQDEFFCMRFCVQRNSMEWYHLENETYEWELFSNLCTSGKTPTHYLVPTMPEPPK